MAPAKTPVEPDDAPLKRLGGGRWQTRDERFTIEPQSGTGAVVDAEQTDDFGMPLVRGPYPSLTAAKEAISSARTSEPAASPLAERIEKRQRTTSAAEAKKTDGGKEPPKSRAARKPADDGRARPAAGTRSKKPRADEPPAEPGWLTDLAAAERGRARRLVAKLTADGVPDPEGIVRRDLVGDVPAVAAHALRRRLDELDADADAESVVALLADGRDEALGVRWRLVDGSGRPILLDPRGRKRR
jgi:hypothetical protein